MQVTLPTKPSEVLEAAKEFLASKRCQHTKKQIYICYALNEVRSLYPESKEAVNEVQNYIQESLKPAYSLGGWLFYRGKIEQYDYFEITEGIEKMHNTRLAWIDHMIVLYKEQGR